MAAIASEMEPSVITKGKYKYVCDRKKDAIDVHHIIILQSSKGVLIFCKYAVLFAISCLLILLLFQDKSVTLVLWSCTVAGFIFRLSLGKQIQKESVIIFPDFGVQLETVYRSGRKVCRFVPIGDILKPVLNECVSPVTCYWSLSLIIRGQEELLLVFKELYPPVSMLVPIWKVLCAAVDESYCPDMDQDLTAVDALPSS